MGFWRAGKIQSAATTAGRLMLNEVSTAGGNPSAAFSSCFHITFLQRFLSYQSAEKVGVSPNDNDVVAGVAGALTTLSNEFFKGHKSELRSAVSDNEYNAPVKQQAEYIVDLIIKCMYGDKNSTLELDRLLPPLNVHFRGAAASAEIDANDLSSRAIGHFFVQSLC